MKEEPKTIEEFREFIDGLADVQARSNRLMSKLDKDILEARDKYAEELDAARDEMAAIVEVAKKFCKKYRKALFGEARSVETQKATLGYALSPPSLVMLNKEWSEEKTVGALEGLGVEAAVITKKTLNRGALVNWDDQQLAAVGLRRAQAERFYVTPKLEEAERRTA